MSAVINKGSTYGAFVDLDRGCERWLGLLKLPMEIPCSHFAQRKGSESRLRPPSRGKVS